MSETTYQKYDFAASARVERPLWLALHRWLEKFAERFVKQYSNFSATTIEAEALLIDAESFEALQGRWEEPTLSAEVQLRDGAVSGMLVGARSELRKLLMDILGSTDGGEASDRELTSIESSLCEMIFEQAANTLAESWPKQEPLTVQLQPMDSQPAESRLYSPEEMLLKSGLLIKLGSESVSLQLMLPKLATTKLLGVSLKSPSAPKSGTRLDPERIADIRVEVSAGLGTTDLPMTELASMAVGDIIVLDQSIGQPLTLFANEQPAFEAWPGRKNQTQAMQITSFLV